MKQSKNSLIPNIELCVDLKTLLREDRVAGIGKHYSGLLLRDREAHFTFTETARRSKGRRSPQVFNGRYLTVTCNEEGRLRLNLKATYLTADFSAKEFSKELAKEIGQALNCLLDKE